MRWTGRFLIVLTFFCLGCARGDWTTETLTLVDVTGTWEGVFKFSEPARGLERTTRWVLRQKGGRVRGEAEGLEGAQPAPIEGQVNGEVLSWQLTGQFFKSARVTSYRGEATITLDEMSGRATGHNCPCTVLLRRAGDDARGKEAR